VTLEVQPSHAVVEGFRGYASHVDGAFITASLVREDTRHQARQIVHRGHSEHVDLFGRDERDGTRCLEQRLVEAECRSTHFLAQGAERTVFDLDVAQLRDILVAFLRSGLFLGADCPHHQAH
jgi:hypothetical protein